MNLEIRTIVRLGAMIGLLFIAGIVAVAIGADGAGQGRDDQSVPTITSAPAVLTEAPPVLGLADELTDLDGWLQSDVTSLAELRGDVVVLQFWTFGCYNCKNTLPSLQHLEATYGDDDFTIVGVHSPEFDFEADPDNIAEAAMDLGVTWPIAIDNNKTNFRVWQGDRRFWPRTYVLDRDGNIRFDHIGEGSYDELEATVAHLLAQPPQP